MKEVHFAKLEICGNCGKSMRPRSLKIHFKKCTSVPNNNPGDKFVKVTIPDHHEVETMTDIAE